MIRKFLLLLVVVALAVAGLAAWAHQRYTREPLALASTPLRINVAKGATLRSLAQSLPAQGVPVGRWELIAAGMWRGDADRIKAGIYQLDAAPTLEQLLDRLVKGDSVLAEIRFIEGTTFRQMRAAVAQHPDLAKDSVALSDEELLKRIGATESHPEGLFLPSRYDFSPGSSDLEIFRQAYRELKRTLEQVWETRAADLPVKTPYEALVLASMIEKETGRDSDREKVSAVLVNRLRKGMLLQSDPTTIYGMGDRFDGNLRRRDLQTDTPYNTYTRPGLPPTPIALPGKASLQAAMQPARIAALYFVARGDGTSEFSDDLAAHNRAVQKYQLKKR